MFLMTYGGCMSPASHDTGLATLRELSIDRAVEGYSVWLSEPDGSEFQILFYGHEGDWRNVVSRRNGGGQSSGAYQTIYYRNATPKQNLVSVTIIGTYVGDPDDRFRFTVQDGYGTELYASPEYSFGEFSSEGYEAVEFPAPVEGIPGDFYIAVQTDSREGQELYLLWLPSDHNQAYSFVCGGEPSVVWQQGGNYSIFPKLE
jgi:hypothetical protein